MASKSINEAERQKMKGKLDVEYQQQLKVQEETHELESRIKSMEESVLVGGVNLVDKAKAQEEEIRAAKSKAQAQAEEQRRLAQEAKDHEEAIVLAEQRYGSLKGELAAKTKKIEKKLGR